MRHPLNRARSDHVGSREVQCVGKVRYSSRKKASLAKRQTRGRTVRLYTYHCPHCGFWHMGRRAT
jgi:hypothetical protein